MSIRGGGPPGADWSRYKKPLVARTSSEMNLGSQRADRNRISSTTQSKLAAEAFQQVATHAITTFNRGVSYATEQVEPVSQNAAPSSNTTVTTESPIGTDAALAENLLNIVQLLKNASANRIQKGRVGKQSYHLKVQKIRRRSLYRVRLGSQIYLCSQIPKPDQYGVTKWEFVVDGRRIAVKEFAEGSYHGPKQEGFLIRKDFLLEAAKNSLERLKEEKKLKPEEQRKLMGSLDALDELYTKQLLHEDCHIDQAKMSGEITLATEHYASAHEKAEFTLAQLTYDVQQVFELIIHGFTLDHLEAIEKEYVIKRDRPTVLNIYAIKDRNGVSQQFLSIQTPTRKVTDPKTQSRSHAPTIPSTLRDRSGLVNYVVTSCGRVVNNPEHPEEGVRVKIGFESSRHSSYPPISIENSYQRQAIACQNVRERLMDLAEKKLLRNPDFDVSKDNPLPITLRTMMLLTPKVGDFVRNRTKKIYGAWTGESETLQFEESAAALDMYDGRLVLLKIGGRDVWIKPDISFMNLGTNREAAGVGIKGKPRSPQSMKDLNARGFHQFDQETHQFFLKGIDKLLDHFITTNQEKLGEKDSNEFSVTHNLIAVKKIMMAIIPKIEENSEIKSLSSEIAVVTSEKRKELDRLYLELEKYQSNLLNGDQRAQNMIDAFRTRITKIERETRVQYRKLHEAKKTVYISRRENIFEQYEKIEKSMSAFIKTLKKSGADPKEVRQFQEMLNFLRCVHIAKDMFYGETYKNPDTVMLFQVFYLKLQSMMGNETEFFCKSAEDRTGRVDDMLQEFEVYRELFGWYPFEKKDFEYINQHIARFVNMYSASQDNTELNSGARGEQIGPEVNKHVLAAAGKQHAGLAKGIFSYVRNHSMKVSPEAEKIIADFS